MKKLVNRVIPFFALIIIMSGVIIKPGGVQAKTTAGPASTASAPARAQWLDAAHISVKMPQGLQLHSGLRFFLAGSPVTSFKFLNDFSQVEIPLLNAYRNFVSLSTHALSEKLIDDLIRQSPKIYITNEYGEIVDSTAIQLAGLLDDRYFYNGPDLGAVFTGAKISLKLWAPTAQSVQVRLYRTGEADPARPTDTIALQRDPTNGVWSTTLSSALKNSYYLYEVQVYQPLTDKVETSLVTDPYGFALSINGTKTQLVDLNASDSKPPGWDQYRKPELRSLNDSVIYELHLRDFSANDPSIPLFHRGTYLAFTHDRATSVQHLRELADAGLTHLHLLPFNDFGSVNEDKNTWQNYDRSPSGNLEEPQNIISRIRAQDPYAWGYDPVHYFAPEGSYAVGTEGLDRVRELRSMVMAINNLNLRVVQDSVFNHTFESSVGPLSVFDKIVPLYYYRLNDDGYVANASCCSDTASEHRMMEKLMVDAVVSWAKNFKIDGFRFDLMSFHTHDNMIHVQRALRGLSISRDKVDGAKILIYGEGWLFGSLFDRNPQASMNSLNSFGLGIGMFNDRMRDAIRGGTTNATEKSDQGFATGLFFDFNQEPANRNTPTDLGKQREKLLHLGDVIKAGLAGNLRDYYFREHQGSLIRAGDLYFQNSPVAAAAQTLETINYVSAHDGYSLWDAIQAKAPFYTPGRTPRLSSTEEKQRMQHLALSLTLLSQGIPFIDAGAELLRSKNGDQDSYDSGDYFNALNWSLRDNTWGAGLPAAWKNFSEWTFWLPRLKDPGMQVSPAQIRATGDYVRGLLRVRKSTPLFAMNTLNEVTKKLSFIDNDQQAEPGLIAMSLNSNDRDGHRLLVFFNSSREPRTFTHQRLRETWQLHPDLDVQVDPELGRVILNPSKQNVVLPGLSTVVLVGAP